MGTFTISLDLPSELRVTLGDTELSNTINLEALSADVLRFGLINGFVKAYNDVSRGEDEDGKPLTDEAWLAKRDKRGKAWADGQWAARGAGERGDSNLRFLKEHYYYEALTERNLSAKKVDAEIKAQVKAVMGDEAKATFDNFMLAVAKSASEPDATDEEIETLYKEIEAGLQERADEAKAKREKTAKKLDVSSILIRPKKA